MGTQIPPQNVVESSQNIVQAVAKKRALRMNQTSNPDNIAPGELTHLAHDTTVEGLYGIIDQGRLRASAAYYLNDSSEIDYGCQLFTSILAEPITDPKMDWLRKNIFEPTQKAFEPGGFMESVKPRTYIACFCENENLLSQWRAYGQSGGYSISFRRQELQSSLTIEDELYLVELRRVIYKKETQIEVLQGVLADVLSALKESSVIDLFKKMKDQENALFFISFNTFLQTVALTEIVRFKYPAFEDEREWRLIVRPKSAFLNQDEIFQLKFRPARGMVIPFLELRPKTEGGLLPIDFVRYGPTLEKKRVEHSLELLFKRKLYSNVTFRGSEIPVILS